MGCGFRSDAAAARILEQRFGVRCIALVLADPSFYHLDTAFCALPCGNVIYYPGAFSPEALEMIERLVAPAQRIALDRADATCFAANAVCFDHMVVLSSCSHAGAINVLRHAQRLTGVARIHAFVGGLHLTGGLFEPIISRTLDELATLRPDVVVPGHCTGWRATHALSAKLPAAYVQSNVGTALSLGLLLLTGEQ